jgi:acetyl esterase/lipase
VRSRFIAALLLCALASVVSAAGTPPEKLLLWPQGAPGAMADGGEETVRVTEQGERVVSNVHRPSLTVYLPKGRPAAARPAVIVIPGGGHRELWTDHEGHNVARFLNDQGIAAFVLFYRLERAPNSTYKVEGHALPDLQQAMRLVRSHAAEWGIDPSRVGTMGFSAGGQLALLGAMKHDAATRPDFVGLIYPGNWPELKFDAQTPPMFLMCGSDDYPSLVANLASLFASLRAAKVPAELHFYDGVPHGFGIRASNSGPITQWPRQFVDWLRVRKIHQGE